MSSILSKHIWHSEYPEDPDLWPKHPSVDKILSSEPTNRITEYTSIDQLPNADNLPTYIPREVRENIRWQMDFYEHPELTQKKYWWYDKEKANIKKRVKKFNEMDNMTPMRSNELDILWKSGLMHQVDRNGNPYYDKLFIDYARWGLPKITYVEWIIPAFNGELIDWVRYFDERATPGTYLYNLDKLVFNNLTDELTTIENTQNFKKLNRSKTSVGEGRWTYTEDPRRLEDDPRVNEEYLRKIYAARKQMPDLDKDFRMPKMFEDFFRNTPVNIKKQVKKDEYPERHSRVLQKKFLNRHNEIYKNYKDYKEFIEQMKRLSGGYPRGYQKDLNKYKKDYLKNLHYLNYHRSKLGMELIEPHEEFVPKNTHSENINQADHVSFAPDVLKSYEDYLMVKAQNDFLDNL